MTPKHSSAIVTLMMSCGLVYGLACGADESWLPGAEAGASGAGRSGEGGTAGTPVGGSAGAPTMGQGGAGGGGACELDGDCDAVGAGSLCVERACTPPIAACTPAQVVVVVAEGFAGEVSEAASGTCYYRSLADGFAAVSPGTTTRLAVYADRAESATPVAVPAGVTFEGHHAQAGQLTELTVAAASPALVSLAEGSGLRGFRLDGKGGKAVVALSGAVTLSGPLELRGGAPALSVEGTAKATVTGTAAAPVRFTANERGVFVGATASLEMTGEGGESLVVEGTTKGAGVLVDKGQPDKGELTLTNVLIRNNVSSSIDGSGGVEVREGRKATVLGDTFTQNNSGLTFQGQDISATVSGNTFTQNNTSITFQGSVGDLRDAFQGVVLRDNDLSGALPVGGSSGVGICGRGLGALDTILTLGPGNQLPSVVVAQTNCDVVQAAQVNSCTTGKDIGFANGTNGFDLECVP